MPDCIVIFRTYVLKFIIEPNKIVYFHYDNGDKLKCCSSKDLAYKFYTRSFALRKQDNIKVKFGLDFSIEEV